MVLVLLYIDQWLWPTKKSVTTKNAGKLLAILIAMQMWWYDIGHIDQWSTSRASLEATGCCHWFEWNTQNTNKTQLLASNYGTNQSLVVCENFIHQNGPSTQLINETNFVKMWDDTTGAEKLAHISSYQTLSANVVIGQKLDGRISAPVVVKLLTPVAVVPNNWICGLTIPSNSKSFLSC